MQPIYQRLSSAPEPTDQSNLFAAIQSSSAIDLSILQPELTQKIVRAIEQLLKDSQITPELANHIVQTGHLPQEFLQKLGLSPQIIVDNLKFNPQTPYHSHNVSPVHTAHAKNQLYSHANYNNQSTNSGLNIFSGQASPINLINSSASNSPLNMSSHSSLASMNSGTSLYGISTPNQTLSANVSPLHSANRMMSSPLHQITQGISFLNTTGTPSVMSGSITKGTPQPQNLPLDLRSSATLNIQQTSSGTESQNLDVNMDTALPLYGLNTQHDWQSQQFPSQPNQPFNVSSSQYLPLVHPQVHMVSGSGNHRSLNNSPISNPGSPGLDMIQEEIVGSNNAQNIVNIPTEQTSTENLFQTHSQTQFLNNLSGEGSLLPQIILPRNVNVMAMQFPQNQFSLNQNFLIPSNHPQISVTDCLGSEITLVASSSEDSMDSLENNPKYSQFRMPQFIISEPSEFDDRPSIMKGIGRKISQENDVTNKSGNGSSPQIVTIGSVNDTGQTDSDKSNFCTTITKPDNSTDNVCDKTVNPFQNFGSNINSDIISPDGDRNNQLFLVQNPSDDANFARRGSDKSLGFSDDSLSNDSNHSANVSPNCEQNITSIYSNIVSISSGFSENRGSFSEHRESFSERAGSEYRGSFSDRGSFSERGDYGRTSFSEKSDMGARSSFSEKGETPRSSFSAQGVGFSAVIGENDEFQPYMSRDSSRTGLCALEKCEEEDSLYMQGDIDKLQKSTLDLRISETTENFRLLETEVIPTDLTAFSLQKPNDYYEIALSNVCSKLDLNHILELLKEVISMRVPPQNIFVLNNPDYSNIPTSENSDDPLENKSNVNNTMKFHGQVPDALNLNLEYSGGIQIELVVCEMKDNKGLKMRRISGDQFEYGKLCQQLISSLTA